MNTTQTTEPIKTNFVFRNIESYISDRMDLRYNTVKLCTEYRYRGEDEYQVLSDRENAGIYVDMKEDNLFKFTKSDYEMYMQSGRIEDFDPYVSYFENLPAWDGEDRIKKLASYVDVEEGDGYYFAVQLKKWLVRVVKCALENNYFNKQVFVFVGEMLVRHGIPCVPILALVGLLGFLCVDEVVEVVVEVLPTEHREGDCGGIECIASGVGITPLLVLMHIADATLFVLFVET